jgi:hypothetical protein
MLVITERTADPNDERNYLVNEIRCTATATTASVNGAAYTMQAKRFIAKFFEGAAEYLLHLARPMIFLALILLVLLSLPTREALGWRECERLREWPRG